MSNMLTRRQAVIGLGAVGALPLGARSAHADLAALEQAAHKEGTITWYIAQVDTETAEVMGRAFTQQYPGIKVDVIRTTGRWPISACCRN